MTHATAHPTLAAHLELVAQLERAGVSHDAAVREATRRLGMAPDAPAREQHVLEKAEQAAIVKLFREHGCTVRSTSQARAAKISIGFPDLFVTHKTLPLAFFWESKRQVGGIISEAQEEFGADCWRCGIRWYAGDRHAALKVLRYAGLA